MKNIYIPNIPENSKKRIVIAGAGFAGIKLVRKLAGKGFQIVMLDKNNFHQFQPLLYQVATAGLEPSAISFPVRKIFQNQKDLHFRIAELQEVNTEGSFIYTNIGKLRYDYLVLAMGGTTNFYGMNRVEENALPMKSASDAIRIRNHILECFEQALLETDERRIAESMNIALVGGGPTGVELAGALSEMRKYIFPKDYPELDLSKMNISLYEASPKLLAGLSEKSSSRAYDYLKRMGVNVFLNTGVNDYDGSRLELSDGSSVRARTVIWAAGIRANAIRGFDPSIIGNSGRMQVDSHNRLAGHENIFALGDIAMMKTQAYPQGHPQVAQPAIQQAKLLGKNLLRINKNLELVKFQYKDKGSMATIGRNLAVADLPFGHLKGFTAWILWSFVHLFTIFGVKNRLLVFLNWMWNYFTYDQSLRLLIKPNGISTKIVENKATEIAAVNQ